MMEYPIAFERQMEGLLGKDFEVFMAAMQGTCPISIRYNQRRQHEVNHHQVPWCGHASYLYERPIFTVDPSFHGGQYYVQEASSMLLWHILQSLPINKAEARCLDLCAAPGGKTTLLLDFLDGDGMLVSNEVIQSRVVSLMQNVVKWGYNNAVVTNNDPMDFRSMDEYFDIIVLDAPCSGEGMFRKDPAAVNEWSADHVNFCSARQKRIMEDVIPCLKPGGYLVYSTCTFNTKENIDNVQHLVSTFDLESVSVSMNDEWGVQTIKKERSIGYQCYPHRVKGEGFFVAIFTKRGNADNHSFELKPQILNPLSKNSKQVIQGWTRSGGTYLEHKNGDIYHYNEFLATQVEYLLSKLKVKYSGVKVGNVQKQVFIPDHALAMSIFTLDKSIARYECSYNEALLFLKKELPQIPSKDKGWLLITYNKLGLGWAKNLGNRINNYYPNDWRIRMDIKSYLHEEN